MKKSNIDRGYIISLFINLAINFIWSMPAWILLITHFIFKTPIILFWVALGIWVAWILISTAIGSFLVNFGNKASKSSPTPNRKNINPYSNKSSDLKK